MSDSEILSIFPSLEGVKEILAEKEAEWSLRSKTLQQLQSFFSSQCSSITAREKELLARYIRDLQPSISQHFAERRSALTRDGCLAISAAAEVLFGERHFYEEAMPAFLSVLLKQLVITIKVISEAAHRAIISMLKACGNGSMSPSSNSHHHHHPLHAGIPVLIEGISASHPQVRGKSAEYIGIVLDSKNVVHLPHELIEAVEAALAKALTDASPDARSNARKAQPALQRIKAAVGLPSGPSSSSSSSSSTSSSSSNPTSTAPTTTTSQAPPTVSSTHHHAALTSSTPSAVGTTSSVPVSTASSGAHTQQPNTLVTNAASAASTASTTAPTAAVPRSLFGSGPQRILKMTTSTAVNAGGSISNNSSKPGGFFSSALSSHFSSLTAHSSTHHSSTSSASASHHPAASSSSRPQASSAAHLATTHSQVPSATASLVPTLQHHSIPIPFSATTPTIAQQHSQEEQEEQEVQAIAGPKQQQSSVIPSSSSTASSCPPPTQASITNAAHVTTSRPCNNNSASVLNSNSSSFVGEDLAWTIENMTGIIDELCRGVDHPNKSIALPALADLGRFIYLHGRTLDTISIPASSSASKVAEAASSSGSSLANTLAERILPILLRILAENPPSATEEEQSSGENSAAAPASTFNSAAMVALEMVMARIPSSYLLPLFLRLCLKNVKASSSSSATTNLALVTAQFCLECIVQLLPFSNPFFGDSTNLREFRSGLQSLLLPPSEGEVVVTTTLEQEEIKKVALLVLNYLDKMFSPVSSSPSSTPSSSASSEQEKQPSSTPETVVNESEVEVEVEVAPVPTTILAPSEVSPPVVVSSIPTATPTPSPQSEVLDTTWIETLSKMSSSSSCSGHSLKEVTSALNSALGCWSNSNTPLETRAEAKEVVQNFLSNSTLEVCNKALVACLVEVISSSASTSTSQLVLVLRLIAQRLSTETISSSTSASSSQARSSLLEELSSVTSTELLTKNISNFLQHSSAAVRKATLQLRQSLLIEQEEARS